MAHFQCIVVMCVALQKNGGTLSNMLCAMRHQFDIVALIETWLNEQNHEIVGFPNYKCRE